MLISMVGFAEQRFNICVNLPVRRLESKKRDSNPCCVIKIHSSEMNVFGAFFVDYNIVKFYKDEKVVICC